MITRNSEARAAIHDVQSYRETLALLKVLALGNQQIEAGEVQTAKVVVKRIRRNRADS